MESRCDLNRDEDGKSCFKASRLRDVAVPILQATLSGVHSGTFIQSISVNHSLRNNCIAQRFQPGIIVTNYAFKCHEPAQKLIISRLH